MLINTVNVDTSTLVKTVDDPTGDIAAEAEPLNNKQHDNMASNK
jgi:hypothetical protein